MKRVLIFLFVLLFAASASAEGAVLSFSSFDGGGYEYTAVIEDPAVLSFTAFREYGSSRKAYETGSAYQMVFEFTGLQAGETRIFISAESPILEFYEMTYIAQVNEALEVSLSAEQSLARFRLYRDGRRIPSVNYEITRTGQDYYLSVDYEEPSIMNPEAADALYKVFETYNMAAWDGFSEIGPAKLESEQFDLEIRLSDGTLLRAVGDNAFPQDYREAMDAIIEILKDAATE